MLQLIFGGLLGLYLGVALHQARLTDPACVRQALALRGSAALKTVLATLGFGMIMTAFLAWLAVIDVDLLTVAPLDGLTLLGGVIFGLSLSACGYTPGTALAGVGGGHGLESLCCVAGCLLGALLLPQIMPQLSAVRALLPTSASTLFQVTLDEPYLWQGGFLGQGCLGAVVLAVALYVPMPREEQEAPAPEATETQEAVEHTEAEEATEATEAQEAMEHTETEEAMEATEAQEAMEHTEAEEAMEATEIPASVPSALFEENEAPPEPSPAGERPAASGRILRPADASAVIPRTEAFYAFTRRERGLIWTLRSGSVPDDAEDAHLG